MLLGVALSFLLGCGALGEPTIGAADGTSDPAVTTASTPTTEAETPTTTAAPTTTAVPTTEAPPATEAAPPETVAPTTVPAPDPTTAPAPDSCPDLPEGIVCDTLATDDGPVAVATVLGRNVVPSTAPLLFIDGLGPWPADFGDLLGSPLRNGRDLVLIDVNSLTSANSPAAVATHLQEIREQLQIASWAIHARAGAIPVAQELAGTDGAAITALILDAPRRVDATGSVAFIGIPTLIWADQDDPTADVGAAETLAERYAVGELVVTSGFGRTPATDTCRGAIGVAHITGVGEGDRSCL